MACYSCGRGFHVECVDLSDSGCCCEGQTSTPESGSSVYLKEEHESIDPKSTGRKRAAKEYPLDPEKDCEWRGLAKAGGGTTPIVGCMYGKQKNRHHGPDKNTMHNEAGNVHRICSQCHNRWHTANDAFYNMDDPNVTPHDPKTKATDQDIIDSDKRWAKIKIKQGDLSIYPHD